jgi:thiol-disulfide isomerase/thioredoxin
MALTPSQMLALGSLAPKFELLDVVSGQMLSLDSASNGKQVLVVMFICNHCPYVKHILPKLLEITREYAEQDITFVAINANDVTRYPDDHPQKMKTLAINERFPFPYLYDETQAIAKAYQAACTPDFFVFDQNHRLQYRGCFDRSSPGKLDQPVTGDELKRAIDALLAGNTPDSAQFPSLGCNIKWKE